MAVNGTLREVIANFLGGTDINYRYTRSKPAAKAKPVLLGHAPRGSTEPVPVTASQNEAPSRAPLHSTPFPGPQALGRGSATPPPNGQPGEPGTGANLQPHSHKAAPHQRAVTCISATALAEGSDLLVTLTW